jgi:chromosome partitioning protein
MQARTPAFGHSGFLAFCYRTPGGGPPELWRDRLTAFWYSGIMNVIAIANQKGGTGKTTTAAALGVLLSRSGIVTHLVDMDPQASLSAAFGVADPTGQLYDALGSRSRLPVTRVAERLTITPSSIDLSRGETQFISEPGREYLLRDCLDATVLPSEATVVVDCPPSLGILSLACLTAATSLCVVVQPGGFELKTLVHLQETVAVLRQRINPRLLVVGAVLTNCHQRRAITEQVADEVGRSYRILGQVRAEARILYATTAGKVYHLTRSKALDDYRVVVQNLKKVLPCLRSASKASAASSAA